MKYRSLEELERSGELHRDAPPHKPMSQRERLGRWAHLLEVDPFRRLNTLDQTEFCDPKARDAIRGDDTPLSIAFADPVLRAEGLADDSYGAAKRFFGLSDGQLHYVVCSCHCGATMLARYAASRVRAVTPRPHTPGLFSRLVQLLRQ